MISSGMGLLLNRRMLLLSSIASMVFIENCGGDSRTHAGEEAALHVSIEAKAGEFFPQLMKSHAGTPHKPVRAASRLLERVFKPATPSLPLRTLNDRPQLLRTCGISVGVYVSLLTNCCIGLPMPSSQLEPRSDLKQAPAFMRR
jgi:hypothetical protein